MIERIPFNNFLNEDVEIDCNDLKNHNIYNFLNEDKMKKVVIDTKLGRITKNDDGSTDLPTDIASTFTDLVDFDNIQRNRNSHEDIVQNTYDKIDERRKNIKQGIRIRQNSLSSETDKQNLEDVIDDINNVEKQTKLYRKKDTTEEIKPQSEQSPFHGKRHLVATLANKFIVSPQEVENALRSYVNDDAKNVSEDEKNILSQLNELIDIQKNLIHYSNGTCNCTSNQRCIYTKTSTISYGGLLSRFKNIDVNTVKEYFQKINFVIIRKTKMTIRLDFNIIKQLFEKYKIINSEKLNNYISKLDYFELPTSVKNYSTLKDDIRKNDFYKSKNIINHWRCYYCGANLKEPYFSTHPKGIKMDKVRKEDLESSNRLHSELHHISRMWNTKFLFLDNYMENLMFLCSNCHQGTASYGKGFFSTELQGKFTPVDSSYDKFIDRKNDENSDTNYDKTTFSKELIIEFYNSDEYVTYLESCMENNPTVPYYFLPNSLITNEKIKALKKTNESSRIAEK